MGSETDIVARLKQLSGVMTAREVFERTADERARRAAGDFEIDRVVPGEIVRNDAGEFFLATRRYPITETHGNTALLAAQQVSSQAVAVIANDEGLRQLCLDCAIFLDTETTGLAGGTGTYAFLVGIGRFEGGTFVIRQYFMRDYDEEAATLFPLADVFRDAPGVVTYNGKAFDIPLLQTRFITARLRVSLEDLPHLDLLHVARRLWRARLRDCCLANIERELLGVTRHGDIPSHLIPQVYFDYLRTRDARRLGSVFYHNAQDILSLVGIVSRAAHLATSPPEMIEAHPLDLLSIARIHIRQRRYRMAECHAAYAYDCGLEPDAARTALHVLALSLKRQHRWDEAHGIWYRLAKHYPDDMTPRVEMAKHLEHRERDLTKAREVCKETIEIGSNLGLSEEKIEQIRYRLARVERKLGLNGLTQG